jgi:hypothetical protein
VRKVDANFRRKCCAGEVLEASHLGMSLDLLGDITVPDTIQALPTDGDGLQNSSPTPFFLPYPVLFPKLLKPSNPPTLNYLQAMASCELDYMWVLRT